MLEPTSPQVVDYQEFQELAPNLLGRLVQVTGRLKASGHCAMTMMACHFPPDAQPGDSIDCNGFFGPTLLVNELEITDTSQDIATQGILLKGVNCHGMEVFTYRGGGKVLTVGEHWSYLVGGKVEIHLRVDSCGWINGPLILGERYIVQGILRQTEADLDAIEYHGMSVIEVGQITLASDVE